MEKKIVLQGESNTRNMNNSQKIITSALEELGAELGISEVDIGGKLTITGKDPVVASRRRLFRVLRGSLAGAADGDHRANRTTNGEDASRG